MGSGTWRVQQKHNVHTVVQAEENTKRNTHFNTSIVIIGRSRWPCCLRLRSAAAPLLRSWFSNPTGGRECLSVVSVVCCLVEVSATSWSLVAEESYRLWCLVVCDLKPREWGGHGPLGGFCAKNQKNRNNCNDTVTLRGARNDILGWGGWFQDRVTVFVEETNKLLN